MTTLNYKNDLLNEMNENSSRDMYLTFKIEEEEYGFDISSVTEIVGMQPVTPIPEAANYIKGIINLRGRIIPVIDLRLKFGKPEKEYNERTCIIVISYGDMTIGFIVDNVSEVITLKEDQLVPLPSYGKDLTSNYVKTIGKADNGIKLLLDCNRIIRSDELNIIEGLISEP
ncbi:MAG: chemotaxis protein CheW [Clostridia bacterium]|jgi:purine-binding chemotaxis protein CheW